MIYKTAMLTSLFSIARLFNKYSDINVSFHLALKKKGGSLRISYNLNIFFELFAMISQCQSK